MIKAVIFDMDGTILNTLDDLVDAVEFTMKKRNHRGGFPRDVAKMFFGSGVDNAIVRALAAEKGCSIEELEHVGTPGYEGKYAPEGEVLEEVSEMKGIFRAYYGEHCNEKTGPYDGIVELIGGLREKGIKTAVVSNKPDTAVKKLCEELFDGSFDFSLGEIKGVNIKPDRAMVDSAIKAMGVSPEEAVYVGDSEIDLLTAKNSGLLCIAVTWGFRGRRFLEEHGADIIIDDPREIEALVFNGMQ